MKLKDISHNLKDWKDVNVKFFSALKQNIKTGKKGLDYSKHILDEFYKNYSPVFFLSTGRCGTKFIANFLKENLFLKVYHHAFPELLFHQQNAFEKPLAEKTKSAISAARTEIIFECYRRNQIFVETNNRLTFYAYALSSLFPKAKFIHIVRHPSEFVISGIRRKWYTGEIIEDSSRIVPVINDPNWTDLSQIEKISWLWNETNQFIEKFKKNTKNPVLSLRAEDVFSNYQIIKNIFKYIGVTDIDPSINKILKKPINKQKTGQFHPYTQWTDKQKNQLKKYTKLASHYNYDL